MYTNLAKAANLNGGFTYSLQTHEFPIRGFAVSCSKKDEYRIRAQYLLAREIARYCWEHSGSLWTPGAHLGAWRQDPLWVLDVSVVVPTLEEAQQLGLQHSQEYFWDLEGQREIRVVAPAPQTCETWDR